MAASASDKMESPERSSRIFVQDLPPKVTEADLRKHFTTDGLHITDIKLKSQRRFAFVGLKDSAEATRATRLFNRSYIRMSRIKVSLARSVRVSPSRCPTNHALTLEQDE